jgi:peptidoglycan/LPS O-acetylase OafA/YrhL
LGRGFWRCGGRGKNSLSPFFRKSETRKRETSGEKDRFDIEQARVIIVHMTAFYVISAICMIWGGLLTTVHYRKDVKIIKQFVVQRRWYIYAIIAVILTIFLISSFVVVLVTQGDVKPGTLNLIIFYGLTISAMFALWLPLLYRIDNKKINETIDVIGKIILLFLFAALWITQWPNWQTPLIITVLLALIVFMFAIANLVKKRRNIIKSRKKKARRLH